MFAEVIVFWCDGCGVALVTRTQDEVSAYLLAVESGWTFKEKKATLGPVRAHFCPEHSKSS